VGGRASPATSAPRPTATPPAITGDTTDEPTLITSLYLNFLPYAHSRSALLRRTTRVLYDAITNGAFHPFNDGSIFLPSTTLTSLWRPSSGSRSRSGLSEYGEAASFRRRASSFDTSIWLRSESMVPPLTPPRRAVTTRVVSVS